MSFQEKLDQIDENQTDAPDALDITIGHAKTLPSHKEHSKKWHAARSQGIGGSDAATIMGMKPYGNTRRGLWRQKTGREEPRIANAATRFGKLIEPYIRLWLKRRAEDTPSIFGTFSTLIDFPAQLQHPDHEWMLGNTDGIITDETGEASEGLEIKQSSVAHGCKKHDWIEGALDIHYAQIQHYMGASGLDRWHYVYLEVPGDRELIRLTEEKFIPPEKKEEYYLWNIDQGTLTHRIIDRDPAYIGRLIEAERIFWNHVETDTPPAEFLPEGEERVEDPKLAGLLDEYGKVHASISASKPSKSLKNKKSELKSQIKALAANHSAALGDVKKIWVNEDDYVLWNKRGYWVAKPAKRKPSTNPDNDIEVPF